MHQIAGKRKGRELTPGLFHVLADQALDVGLRWFLFLQVSDDVGVRVPAELQADVDCVFLIACGVSHGVTPFC